MNGIEKITDRIAMDSDQEAKELLSRAKKQASDIEASYDILAENARKEILEKGKADAADQLDRMGRVAQLEARQRKLGTKQEMLECAFTEALSRLLALPDDQYTALLAKLAADGSENGHESLVFSVKDRPRFGKKVVIAANERLAQAGKPAALTLSEESREFEGGLYIKDGSIENNCTFTTIIRMLREQISGEVAKILFEN